MTIATSSICTDCPLIADVTALQGEISMNQQQHEQVFAELKEQRTILTAQNNILMQHGSMLMSADERLTNHTKMLAENSEMIAKINDSLDSILNIQVNGRAGLQNSLQDIYNMATAAYDATKGIRSENRLKIAFNAWIHDTKFGTFLSTKIGKAIVIVVGTWVILSSMYTLGIIPAHPTAMIKTVYDIVSKLI